ncbi:Lnb N-terminal periplasmic domain-containing protein [Taibaiella koreensis]|uniref:Lnb N-terminal periplasmic domain-containing protein n=1 Tax=Taibaiella koreensis TaxID=1268548 RepID=UPI000E5A0DD5|nr:DUF4105 domain-containing protein [Taibaiella koreensis]
MRRYILFLLLSLCTLDTFAQADSTLVPATDSDHIRISILTCGVGDELYSSFGHTGVRVMDTRSGADEVYNYGTFNFNDPDFYQKFTLGKLPYYLEKGAYGDFMYTYVEEKRNVREQVLDLSTDQKRRMIRYLENNLKPEYREYQYDFLFDNCATRVRDIFPRVLGDEFYFGDVLSNKKISYRDILNQYLADKHWERFGINLLLGSKVDSLMTDEGAMFLPDFIHKGLVHAKFRGKHVVGSDRVILDHKHVYHTTFNGPLWMMIGLLILTALSFLVRSFRYLKAVLRFLLLFITGLLGIFMLFMWLCTNHQSCADNFNILWAVPFNVIVAFVAHKRKQGLRIYALAAISLVIVALIVHLLGFQRMPLIELAPLLLCMMYIYIDMYKQNIGGTAPAADAADTANK